MRIAKVMRNRSANTFGDSHFGRAIASFAAVFAAATLLAIMPPLAADGPALLDVSGDVPSAQSLTLEDLQALPRASVEIREADGSVTSYDGVALKAILERAGVEFGSGLKGEHLHRYVRAGAADGYRTVLSLPEVESLIILVADRKNGNALAAAEGPLKLVLPDAPRRARWVRQLRTIDIVAAD